MLKISTAWFRQPVACPHCDCSFSLSSLLSDPGEDSGNLSAASLQRGNAASPAQHAESLPQSKQLGRYRLLRLLRLLGAGGFGVVYLAEDPELGRQVAIKMPRLSSGSKGNKSQSQSDGRRARARFQKEARAAAKLRHPNIVAVFDHGENADGVFIVYEYVAGETLEHAIEHGELQREESLRHVIAVAKALAYAARENIVHRDIKPANIMLDERGSPQIMDFGLAEALDGGTASTGGSIAGTPAYMSPEQARGDRKIGPASDQYALAAILYELVCGTRAITVRGRAAIAEIADRESPPLQPLAVLDQDLRCIILKAMHREPEQRYSSAGEFAQDLQDHLRGLPVAANPCGPVGRLLKWSRRNRPTAAALAASLVLLMGIALVSSAAAIMLQQGQQALSTALDDAKTARLEAERQAANTIEQKKLADDRAIQAQESQRLAEQEKQRAEQQRQRAEKQEQIAKRALAKELEAKRKRELAEQLAAEAIESEEQTSAELKAANAANRTLQYSEWLARAAADIRRHDYDAARRSLEKCDPQQRGWEWKFLLQACESDADYYPLSETPQDLRKQLAFPTYLSQFSGYEIYDYGDKRMPFDDAEERASIRFTPDRRFGFAIREDVLYRFDFAAATRLVLFQASELHSVEPLGNEGVFAVNVTRTAPPPNSPRG
ncbi:protein kinase domain-containing protein [Roseimaritima ulvae]|uniref:Serine/threonine-protein kinase PrkC n=1 Tax=Roseimaritima ulvae TaxID=980254 RepID=A0A5B9QZ33_9BACT|nr:protein kinase [Roseimaritima ulvae]QEG39261.1 Serine/threonine-protein kinase PrkC [Roseimaritima ulvae]